MNETLRSILALPLEQQREALLPLYRAAYDAYGRDWGLNTAVFADEYVFEARGSRRMPGLPDAVSGRDGYIEMHSHMLEDLNVERVEVDDLLPLPGNRVATRLRFVIRAGDGTIEQHCLDLHHFREDGALQRQTVWLNQEEGLRELGL